MPGQPRAYCGKYLSRWPGFDSWVVQHGRNIRSMQLFSTSGLMASLMLQAHIATGGVLHLPRLKQLSCDFSPRSTVRLLAILPCSLTQLHLAPESRQSEDASGDELLANAIAQLTRLECLQLGRHCCSSTVLLVLRDLTYLTQLKLCDQNTALGDVSVIWLGLDDWGDGFVVCCRTVGSCVNRPSLTVESSLAACMQQKCTWHGMHAQAAASHVKGCRHLGVHVLTCALPYIVCNQAALY